MIFGAIKFCYVKTGLYRLSFFVALVCAVLLIATSSCGKKESGASPREPEAVAIERLDTELSTDHYPEAEGKFHFHHGRSWIVGDYSVRVMAWGQGDSASLSQCLIRVVSHGHVSAPVKLDIDGAVVESWVVDLDTDGDVEVIVWSQSAGSGSYGEALVYELREGELCRIALPGMTTQQMDGYMGHDEFRVAENRLVREFPLYHKVDPNAEPTDGRRVIQFQLQGDRWDSETHDVYIEKVKGQIKRVIKKLQ